ncbi:hypothetical protein [Polyangium sp. 6x1]|uniref:hypothetical protein n=1 Tax=Polyangium sp. 6x1 TaxID=3042689 RepID=UPI002482EA73|nr:hypothetical protein [Polyangium sp. 6x1]MDI1447447.1 hypothetical protein [Polyangium sp. 6x1]
MSLMPMGCGASDEYAAVPEPLTEGSLPASTVRALQACAEERAGRLQRHAYEIEFQVELRGDRVSDVAAKGPRLDDAGLEQCMMDALRTMTDAGYSPNPDELISRGGLLPSRGFLANVSVISQLIRLVPVVVSASGVTIVVGVAVLVVAAAVSLPKERKPTKEECDEEWADAERQCEEQLKIPGRKSGRGVTGGYTNQKDCEKGLVTPECGGTPVDHGSKIPQPGRRY